MTPQTTKTARLATAVLAAVGLLTSADAALAHHSFAMFDLTKKLTLVGTVTRFEWTNPHSFIWVLAPGPDGKVKEWAAEGQSPNFLGRRGWSKRTVQPGDKITLIISPLKDGAPGGMFSSMVLADGQTMTQSGIGAGATQPPGAPAATPAAR